MKMKTRNILFFTLSVVFIATSIFLINSSSNKVYSESKKDSLRSSLNDEVTSQRRNIITKTVAEVSPAVVGINVTEIRQVQYRDPFSSFFDDPFFRQFFGNRSFSQQVKGLGSGFIVSDDGYIITNDHVAGNASEIVVTMTNGKHYKAKIIGSDPVSDICLLKIDESNLPHIKLGNSDDILIGEWVIAFGNPFGLFDVNNKPTVTVGVISAQGMNLDPVNNRFYLNMIQTDAAINGGNSGGPLINSLGEVIGMNTLIFTTGTSQGSIGLGFAIPINKVKNIVDELKENGKIDRDFTTGLSVQNVDEAIANYFKLNEVRGVIITKILKNSAADKAGLEPGDVIIEIDNFKVTNEQSLLGILQEYRSNQSVSVKIVRENSEKTFSLKLTGKS